MTLNDRRDLTMQTRDEVMGRAFAWGQADCGIMVLNHLARFGYGDRIDPGRWTTPIGLQRWLARNGGSGGAFLDGITGNRIVPARRIIGDVVEMPSDLALFGSFGVALNNGRVLCWIEGRDDAVILQPVQFLAAWRV